MVRHYDSEHEAYATRHELREQRLQRARNSPAAPTVVSLVDRYMFDLQGFFVVRVRPAAAAVLTAAADGMLAAPPVRCVSA